MTTKQLNARLPEDIWIEIDQRKTEELTQTDIVVAALRAYFNPVTQSNTYEIQRHSDEIQNLKDVIRRNAEAANQAELLLKDREHDILRLTDQIEVKDKLIKALENQVGFLQLEFGKLDPVLFALMPSKEEIEKKKWWQFWK
jgi:chromosome segregation ATPase